MAKRAVNRLRSYEQVSRATRSTPYFAFDLRDPRLHQLLNQCSRQWLVRGELDCPFGSGEALKFVFERFDNRSSGEQTAVVRKRGEPHQHSFVLERRNPIADRLGGLRWHNGPDRGANLVQGAAGWFRDTRKVFINGSRSTVAFSRRTAMAGFRFFHGGNATRPSASSPCPRPPCSRSTSSDRWPRAIRRVQSRVVRAASQR